MNTLVTQVRLRLAHMLFWWAVKMSPPKEKEYRRELEEAFLTYSRYAVEQMKVDLSDWERDLGSSKHGEAQ